MAKRLLVVEHNPVFLEGLALLLRWRTGLSSVRAGSLAEAVRVLDEAGQDLACVVVDLDLPEGGGDELLRLTNGTPTPALVGGGGLERRTRAFESGAAEVLSTAGPVEDIVAAVERLIDHAPAQPWQSGRPLPAFRTPPAWAPRSSTCYGTPGSAS